MKKHKIKKKIQKYIKTTFYKSKNKKKKKKIKIKLKKKNNKESKLKKNLIDVKSLIL